MKIYRLKNGSVYKTFSLTLILLLLVNFIVATPSYAYIDAGTGSILLQALLAGVAGGLVIIKMYWRKFTSIFRSDKDK